MKLSAALFFLSFSSVAVAVLGTPATLPPNVRGTKAAAPTEHHRPVLVSGLTNPVHAQLLQSIAQQLAENEDRPKSATTFKSLEQIEPLAAYARSCGFLDLTC